MVAELLEVMQLDRARAVGQHLLLAYGLQDWLPAVFLRFIRVERVRHAERLLEIGLVQLVREDGRPFGDGRPQAARVVDVAVRVDDVLDGLVRNQPFGFGDDREPTSLALPGFDDRDVVLEVDRDRRIASRNQIHAVADLL